MELLEIEHELVGGRCVVEVAGAVDESTFTSFRQYLRDRIAEGHRHLVVDLEQTDLLGPTGLGVLVGLLKRLREIDGSLHLVLSNPKNLGVFKITRMESNFAIHATRDAVPALAA